MLSPATPLTMALALHITIDREGNRFDRSSFIYCDFAYLALRSPREAQQNMRKPKPKSLLKYSSMQNAFQNMTLARGKPVPDSTRNSYLQSMSLFILYCNSKEGSTKEWNPDELLAEAREDVEKAQVRIVNFFQWQQGIEISGYEPWMGEKGERLKVSSSTARARAYGSVRRFYSNNDVVFPKRFDERNGKFVLNRNLLKQFLSNKKLRDQTIALSLLSTIDRSFLSCLFSNSYSSIDRSSLVERMNEFEALKMAVLDEDMEKQSRELCKDKQPG